MTTPIPDYFAPAPTEAEAVLRRVKGNTRREMIAAAFERGDTVDSVPADWKSHNLPKYLKQMLQRQHPQARGGEDLPDLGADEVEIARVTLVDSVHGEIFSLRARRTPNGGIALSLVDEWDTDFTLPPTEIAAPMTAEQLLRFLQAADPSPLTGPCQLRLDSAFYLGLDDLADRLMVKQFVEGD